jgi:hypothetical protein
MSLDKSLLECSIGILMLKLKKILELVAGLLTIMLQHDTSGGVVQGVTAKD